MKLWEWVTLISVVVAGAAVFALPHVGRLEGYLFPVMEQMKIVRVFTDRAGDTRVDSNAVKLRVCSWRRTQYYLGSYQGGYITAVHEYSEKDLIRGLGLNEWFNTKVSLTPDDLLYNSFVIVWHQCPNRPYLTQTLFYQSQEPKA